MNMGIIAASRLRVAGGRVDLIGQDLGSGLNLYRYTAVAF